MGIILNLVILVAMLIPFIICVIVTAIVIILITTKAISKTFKIVIVLIVLLSIFIIVINIRHEEPNNLYIQMKQRNDNKSLVGLSKEQVAKLLGEPAKTHENTKINKDIYKYHAGQVVIKITLGKHTMWRETYWYILYINFDETNKVESTEMKESIELRV